MSEEIFTLEKNSENSISVWETESDVFFGVRRIEIEIKSFDYFGRIQLSYEEAKELAEKLSKFLP